MDTQLTLFDYNQLDINDRKFCQERAKRIRERNRRIGIDIWKNGRDFAEVQERLADHSGGVFVEWAENETRFSKSTVYNFINVYRHFSFPTVGKLDFTARTLYLLSAPSTPEPARKDAIDSAEAGEEITYTKAKEIVTEHKEQTDTGSYSRNDLAKIIEGKDRASRPIEVIAFSHESVEYYTPPEYIEAARNVMGAIDLDPASCDEAQRWIKANKHYTIEDDGLKQEWAGRIWLNPPYSKTGARSNQEIWATRLIAEYKAGRVTEAILLIKAALGYNWFETLWYDWPICFARKRISFIKADGSDDGQSKQGTIFLYLGTNTQRFIDVFRQFGRVILSDDGFKPL